MSNARRWAEFVLIVPDSFQMSDRSNLPVQVTRESDHAGSYLVVKSSDEMTSEPVEVHLDRLQTNCQSLLTMINEGQIEFESGLLRVTQYIGAGDDSGPGVPMNREWISAMATVNGMIDIDIYVDH